MSSRPPASHARPAAAAGLADAALWVPGWPAAEPGAALRFELAVAGTDTGTAHAAATGAAPFLSLGDGGRFARVLLARLADGAGRTVRLLACKLQRDVYRALGSAAAARIDNREVEAMWRRERLHLERLAGAGAPDAVMVPAPPGAPADDVLPPLCWDPARRRLFRPLDPATFAPLAECRDDERLRAAGLQPWSTSLVRYLHAPGELRTFWSPAAQGDERPQKGVRLRRGAELYAELVAAWRAADGSRRAEVAAQWPDTAAALDALAALPALPDAGGGSARLGVVPFNFLPARFVLTALQDLHFDEFCDLAGGATVAALANSAPAGAAPGRAVAFARIGARLAGEGQWLAAPWTRGDDPAALAEAGPVRLRRLALEASWLKVQAFAQVCRIAREHHARLQQPHLGLSPDNVMLRLLDGAAAPAPVRWCFAASVVDLGSSHRVALAGTCREGSVPALFAPATDAVRTFLSPLAAPGRGDPELAVHVAARPLEGGGPGLALELRAAHERLVGIEPGDVVRVLADAPLPGGMGPALLGVVTAVTRTGADAEIALAAEQTAALPESPFAFAATAGFHRRLGPACDLFPLGMLLLRALLGNDAQDVFALRERFDRLLDRLDVMLGADADPRRVAATVQHLLDQERPHLGSEQVLHGAASRARVLDGAEPAGPVPAALWRDLLTLGVRLLSARRGFGFAAHHGDGDPQEPARILDAVLAEVDELLARLVAELGDRPVRDAELQRVTGELLGEVRTAMVGSAEGPP